MNLDFTMTIDGRAEPGREQFAVVNPASGEAFAQAPDCTREELDAAVAAAHASVLKKTFSFHNFGH